MTKTYSSKNFFGLVDVTKVEYSKFINPENNRENFRVTIECTDMTKEYDLNTLTSPDRIYVDIYNSVLKVADKTIEVKDDLVKAIRLGQFNETTVRVVVDLKRMPEQDTELCTVRNQLCIDIFKKY